VCDIVVKKFTFAISSPDEFLFFFSNRVVNGWNKLDQQIVGATSLNAIKNGLDKLRKTKMGFLHGLIGLIR